MWWGIEPATNANHGRQGGEKTLPQRPYQLVGVLNPLVGRDKKQPTLPISNQQPLLLPIACSLLPLPSPPSPHPNHTP
ncbi:MAG: hypothetical protein ACRC2V_26720 [Xenococcaceae cyanobacterium]